MNTIALASPLCGDDFKPGISHDALKLAATVVDIRRGLRTAKSRSIEIELINLFSETSEANWDGYGAEPVCAEALITARKFLNLLPHDIPTPEIAANPAGEVVLEWYFSKTRLVSLDVAPNRTVTYIGFCGPNRQKGVECFDQTIPGTILALLRRVTR